MLKQEHVTTEQQILKSLEPSNVSAGIAIGLAALITIAHFLYICLRQGALLPNFLDGEWAKAYNELVVTPVDHALAATTLNNILVIVMWGFLGLIVYTGVEHAIKNYNEYNDAEREILIVNRKQVVRRPLLQQFLIALAWRTVVGCIFFAWGIAALVVLGHMGNYGSYTFYAIPRGKFIVHLLGLMVGWIVLFHVFVILMRFALRRTRLFKRTNVVADPEAFFRW